MLGEKLEKAASRYLSHPLSGPSSSAHSPLIVLRRASPGRGDVRREVGRVEELLHGLRPGQHAHEVIDPLLVLREPGEQFLCCGEGGSNVANWHVNSIIGSVARSRALVRCERIVVWPTPAEHVVERQGNRLRVTEGVTDALRGPRPEERWYRGRRQGRCRLQRDRRRGAPSNAVVAEVQRCQARDSSSSLAR